MKKRFSQQTDRATSYRLKNQIPRQANRPTAQPPNDAKPQSPGGKISRITENKITIFLLFPVLIILGLLFLTIRSVPDPDVWFHMALGRVWLDTGSLPRGDLFSFTSQGNEWISSGWLPSVWMEMAFRKASAKGLVWLVFGVVAAAYLLIYFVGAVRYKAGGALALILLAGMLAGYLRFTPRPEAWSQFFLAALILLLLTAAESPRWRDGRVPKRLFLLPLIFVFWANCHAGFAIGYVPLGIFMAWLWMARRRLGERTIGLALLPCSLAFGAWLINPYGARLAALGGKISAMPHVREYIMEWTPLLARTNPMLPLPAYIGAAAFFLLAWGVMYLASIKRRLDWWHVAILLFLTGIVFYQRRHAGIAAAGMAAALTPYMKKAEESLGRLRRALPFFAAAIAALFGFGQHYGVFQTGRGLFVTGIQGGLLPAYATQYLQSNRPPANVFNSYGIGGYLLYFLGPETRVFIDGRLDVYDAQVWLDYIAIKNGTMPIEEAVRRYQLNTFILYTGDVMSDPNHLAYRLSALPEWERVYADKVSSVFIRSGASGSASQ